LGLGEASVSSSLNQPLKAELELVNIKDLDSAEILPGLATREEFLKAGVDRVYFLSDMRFQVETRGDGSAKVILTTKKPVREPFLNFLVEVIWPSGRLLREYALLIDPPLFAEDKTVAAKTAGSQAQLTQQVLPVKKSALPVSQIKETSERADTSGAQASSSFTGSEYGPVSRKDTLWDIALKTRPDRSVSPQQVMLAIQDLNPNAFIDNNINKVKIGQVLRLPTKDQIQARSASQAVSQVIAQNEALRKPKSKSVVSASKQTEQPPKPAVTVESDDQLKLVVADQNAKQSDTASSDQVGTSSTGASNDAELELTLEQLDKANLENDELSGRVDDLQEQLDTLQRLLTLKNDQLAGLQDQMRASELAESQASQELSVADKASEDSMTKSETNKGADAVEVRVTETISVKDVVLPDGADEKEVVVIQDKVIVEKVVEVPTEPKAEQPIQEKLLSLLLNNPLYQLAVAGFLILLLIIFWLIARRNASEEISSDENVHDSLVARDPTLNDPEVDGSQESQPEADLSTLEFDALEQQSETGPASEQEGDGSEGVENVIAEADVYIAYGRLDQAIQILEQGISDEPVRVDYRLKLLSVLKESLAEEAFGRQFSELEAIQDQEALAEAGVIRDQLNEALAKNKDQSADHASDDYLTAEPSDLMDDVETAETNHLLDEAEEAELLSNDENNFDFDTVEEDTFESMLGVEELNDEGASEALEKSDLASDLDLDSDDLELDLDLDLSLSGADAPVPEEVSSLSEEIEAAEEVLDELGSVDLGSVDIEEVTAGLEGAVADLEMDGSESALAVDDELGDIDMAGELDQESEISLPDDITADLDISELTVDLDEPNADDESIADIVPDANVDESTITDEATEAETDEPSAASLELGDDLLVTDDILEEAVEALGDADDFEPELSDTEDFDFLEGTDEASTKLDLARAYIDMGDIDGAREILQEVEGEGSADQRLEAKELLGGLDG
jgi:pilus assembly protein FimV